MLEGKVLLNAANVQIQMCAIWRIRSIEGSFGTGGENFRELFVTLYPSRYIFTLWFTLKDASTQQNETWEEKKRCDEDASVRNVFKHKLAHRLMGIQLILGNTYEWKVEFPDALTGRW